jgi:hypothetical protein
MMSNYSSNLTTMRKSMRAPALASPRLGMNAKTKQSSALGKVTAGSSIQAPSRMSSLADK